MIYKSVHVCSSGRHRSIIFFNICSIHQASASEKLVLKYNPNWSGAGETKHPIDIPDCYKENFALVYHEEFTLRIPFTRESWNGRMKACRGIGASLTKKEISMWEQEHMQLLKQIAPNEFDILHYIAIAELKKH